MLGSGLLCQHPRGWGDKAIQFPGSSSRAHLMIWLLEGSGASASKPGMLFCEWVSQGMSLPSGGAGAVSPGALTAPHPTFCECSLEKALSPPPLFKALQLEEGGMAGTSAHIALGWVLATLGARLGAG